MKLNPYTLNGVRFLSLAYHWLIKGEKYGIC